MKNLIEQVYKKLQAQEFVTLQVAKDEISTSSSGFYWVYTKLPLSKFSNAISPADFSHKCATLK